MDLLAKLRQIADRVPSLRVHIATEEATKNALVMPFIQALGYDIFDPTEVVPEFTADVGIKKGEKVDYAIIKDGTPIVLIECKEIGAKLSLTHGSQLYRYFTTTNARIAILTNGVEYRFFTDLKSANRMDDVPFLVLDLLNLREDLIGELRHLSKATLDVDALITSAGSLLVTSQIKNLLAELMASPDDAFARVFAERLHFGRITQAVVDKYRALVAQAADDFVRDQVDARLRAALSKGTLLPNQPEQVAEPDSDESSNAEEPASERGVETTVEELEGFFTVRAILRDLVEPRRIHARDVRSYFGILLDNSNRKPICRLHFNGGTKYLEVFEPGNVGRRIEVASPDEIFAHAEHLRSSLKRLLNS